MCLIFYFVLSAPMVHHSIYFKTTSTFAPASERTFVSGEHPAFALLIAELGKLGVGSWRTRYDTLSRAGVHDWSLRVYCDEFNIDCRGKDAYPPDFDAARLLIQTAGWLFAQVHAPRFVCLSTTRTHANALSHAGTRSTVQINRSRSRAGSP